MISDANLPPMESAPPAMAGPRQAERFSAPRLRRPSPRSYGEIARCPVMVRNEPDQVAYEAELPGFAHDDLGVTIRDGMLTIAANRDMDRQDAFCERLSVVRQTMRLPADVCEESADVEFAGGLLTIVLQKKARVNSNA